MMMRLRGRPGRRQEKDRLVTSTIVPWKAKQKGENYWRKLMQGQGMHAWFCECLEAATSSSSQGRFHPEVD